MYEDVVNGESQGTTSNATSTLLSLGSFSIKTEPGLTTLTPEPDTESEIEPNFNLQSLVGGGSGESPDLVNAGNRGVTASNSASKSESSMVSGLRIKQEPTLMMSSSVNPGESSLADLDSLTDLFPLPSDLKLDIDSLAAADDLDSLDSASLSSGSHFEFSCTPDVNDMLMDIGVSNDWVDKSFANLINC